MSQSLPDKEDIQVAGNAAIYYSKVNDQETRRVNFSDHMNVLGRTMWDIATQGKAKFIAIEAQTRTGATGFSSVLAASDNVTHINVINLRHPYSSDPIDISDLITDSEMTYVIDGLNFAQPDCIPVIEQHVESGGTVVVFVQNKAQLVSHIEPTWLSLTKHGLGKWKDPETDEVPTKWTYVDNILDTTYSQPLPDVQMISTTALPESEFTLRKFLTAWLMTKYVPYNSLSWLDKLLDKKNYKKKVDFLHEGDKQLKELLEKPEYMAAFQRVLSRMPDHVPHKEYLQALIAE